MTGLTGQPGCIAISSLREVGVNYWGIDGYRYRGQLIVNAAIARRVASVFAGLYNAGVRFHSMHPEDVYGPNPRGRGANDYASMRSGNSSAFNCRYIVDKESMRAISPHASGRAIDVNPWENPYIARGGVCPNSWWLHRPATHPLVLTRTSAVVRTLVGHGCRWGARFGDYQHFDC